MTAFVRWGLYPLFWLWTGGFLLAGVQHPDRLEQYTAIHGVGVLATLLLCELLFPYEKRWGMTWRNLLHRDLIFIAINGATLAAIRMGLALVAIDVARGSQGPMTGAPLGIQVGVGLLVFEALQYTVHRAMHTDRGAMGRFLWRTHAIHHLPQQLYAVMHAVFHPLNAIVVRIGVQVLPVWWLGFDPLAVYMFAAIIGLHGAVSHFNVDMRMGWANYLFVGPELHRYHHSARAHEAVNYGATLSLFDVVLGTLRYTPGRPPESLGLREEDGYPEQHDPVGSCWFPFRPVRLE